MRKVLLITVLLGFFIAPALSSAWDCGQYATESWFVSSHLVFVGKVIRIEPVSYNNQVGAQDVTFSISKVYKGKIKDTVTVRTGLISASPGYPFQCGLEYIVYASQSNEEKGLYGTTRCSPTAPVDRTVLSPDEIEYMLLEESPEIPNGKKDELRKRISSCGN